MEQQTKTGIKNIAEGLIVGLSFLAILGNAVVTGVRNTEKRTQNTIEQVVDLNGDGITDAIFVDNENHYRKPYFGKLDGTNKVYLTAKAMQKANTNDYFNYLKLEEELNQR